MTGKRDEGSRRTNQVHFGTALFCRKKSGAEVGERNPMEQQEDYRASPRDFLAAERTFLAWIWTGVALMALGFVLPRFGLFVHQFNLMRPDVHTASYGFSLWFGTVLILLGVVVCLLALVRYLRLLAMTRKGARSFGNVSALAVAVAVLLGILGLAMSYYLVSARRVSVRNHFNSQEASMPAAPGNGMVRTASRHPVEETVTKLQAMLQAKNVKIVCHRGSQRRSGEHRDENAEYQVVDLWQSEGRNTADAGCPECCPGLAAENSCGGGQQRKSLHFLHCAKLFAEAP
jgi:putative membrane protein